MPSPPCCVDLLSSMAKTCACFETRVREALLDYDFWDANPGFIKSVLRNATLARIRWLAEMGWDPTQRTLNQSTTLMTVARGGRIDVAKWILDLGVDVHAIDVDGKNALMYGCMHVDMVRLLLARGIQVETKDFECKTVFMHVWKSVQDPIPVLDVLLKAGAQRTDIADGDWLVWAFRKYDRLRHLRWIADHGVSLEPVPKQRIFPLCKSIRYRYDDCVAFLLERGADVNATNPSPLIAAIHCGKIVLVKTLLARGADPNQPGLRLQQRTGKPTVPLHEAMCCGENAEEMVCLLLHCGARVDECNDDGETAFWISVKKHRPVLRNILYEAGANIDATMTCNVGLGRRHIVQKLGAFVLMTPLMWELSTRGTNFTNPQSKHETFRWLLRHGASLGNGQGVMVSDLTNHPWYRSYLSRVAQHRRVDTVHALAPVMSPDTAGIVASFYG